MIDHKPLDELFPPIGLDLASVVLGAIALLLFILPILSLPISGTGIVLGAMGIGVALRGGRVSLRLSVAGVVVCVCAFAIVWAIKLAPTGYYAPRTVYPVLQPVKARPYVPPPAPSRAIPAKVQPSEERGL